MFFYIKKGRFKILHNNSLNTNHTIACQYSFQTNGYSKMNEKPVPQNYTDNLKKAEQQREAFLRMM